MRMVDATNFVVLVEIRAKPNGIHTCGTNKRQTLEKWEHVYDINK